MISHNLLLFDRFTALFLPIPHKILTFIQKWDVNFTIIAIPCPSAETVGVGALDDPLCKDFGAAYRGDVGIAPYGF